VLRGPMGSGKADHAGHVGRKCIVRLLLEPCATLQMNTYSSVRSDGDIIAAHVGVVPATARVAFLRRRRHAVSPRRHAESS